ncbi:FtsX-like permease family protein, partial [bacterium]|nr:FtsX-like permease family protein [bacterium]
MRSNDSLEADILFVKRYMIDRIKKLDKCPIKYSFIDIEVLADELPNVQEALYPISCISAYNSVYKNIQTWYLEDYSYLKNLALQEKKMLDEFILYMRKEKFDLWLSWNVKFDYNYLYNRVESLKNYGKKNFGELISPIGKSRYGDGEVFYPAGISIVDYLGWDKKVTLNRRKSYALDNVAQEVLGDKANEKIEFGKLNSKIKEKNVRDVERMVKLEEKLKYIDYFDEIRRLTKVEFEDMVWNSRIIDMLLLEEAKNKKIVLPMKPSEERGTLEEKTEYQGAYRDTFKTGRLSPVGSYDLSSCYPSMIVDFCLDPTNICDVPLNTPTIEGDIRIEESVFRQNPNTLLPIVTKKLLTLKNQIKQRLSTIKLNTQEYKNEKVKYEAVKGIVNSAYGVFGNRFFRLYNPKVASTTTYLVRDLLHYVQDKLEKQGKDSGRFLTDPNKHFFQDSMDGIFLLLGVLGALALVLGLLLVYNTINALISQQVDQIGVMKAVGAQTWQILRLYLITIMAYGILALLFALPIGIFGAWAINSWLIGSFGADPGSFAYSQSSIAVMTIICLLAPILASLIPIFSGARITVREAISTYGLGTDTGLIERLLSRAKHISRLLLITISNTFRHKRRVLLLEIALVLSGLIFMMVVSVRDSVVFTIQDVMFSILNADITMVFEDIQRIDYVEEVTLSHPEVKAVELWGLAGGTMRPAGQDESEDDEETGLFGVPLPTELYGYQLRKGRWLDPNDNFAIVLNQDQAEEIEVDVGDWVTVQYEEKQERDWQVVGLVFDPILTTISMVPRDVLLRDTGNVGKSSAVWIQTHSQDPERQIAFAKDLRVYYEKNHIDVSPQRGIFGGMGGDATVETSDTLVNQFNFLVILLAIMAVVIAAVGSIALSGTLSLSVLERRREIGVMRAIGASSWTI